jgi:hypothetical protein
MTKQHIPLQKIIWNKIRYYQRLNDISNDTLAGQLKVHTRTLYDYDKKADNVTLVMVNNFLDENRITLDELLKS